MRRRLVVIVSGLGLAVAASTWGYEAFGAWRAERLTQRAERLLSIPYAEAPEPASLDAAAAAQALRLATDLEPTSRRLGLYQHALALEALQQGAWSRARDALHEARAHLGWVPRLRVLAAELARRSGELDAAHQHAVAALQAAPRDPRALQAAADVALDRAQPARALTLLERLADTHPQLAAVENRRGLALEAEGRWEEALARFAAAARFDTEAAAPWLNRGRLLRRRDDLRAARDAFSQALRRADTDVQAYLGRGLCALESGDLAAASEDLARAAELAPASAEPRVALGDVAMARGRMAKALEHYRNATSVDPRSAVAWLKLGNAWMRASRFADAVHAYGEAVDRDATLAAAHNGLGAAWLQQGEHARSENALRRAADLDPEDPHPWMNLARLHEARGRARDAHQAWQQALSRAPQQPIARRGLSRTASAPSG